MSEIDLLHQIGIDLVYVQIGPLTLLFPGGPVGATLYGAAMLMMIREFAPAAVRLVRKLRHYVSNRSKAK